MLIRLRKYLIKMKEGVIITFIVVVIVCIGIGFWLHAKPDTRKLTIDLEAKSTTQSPAYP